VLNIEFNAVFKAGSADHRYEINTDLVDYLTNTTKGKTEVLKWLSKGCKKLYDSGNNKIVLTESLNKMKNTYLLRIDPVKGFLDTIKFSQEYNNFIKNTTIRVKFTSYLKSTPYGLNEKLIKKVYQEITKRCKKVKNDVYGYKGLMLMKDHDECNEKYDLNNNMNKKDEEAIKEMTQELDNYELVITKMKKKDEQTKITIEEQKNVITDLQNKLNDVLKKLKKPDKGIIEENKLLKIEMEKMKLSKNDNKEITKDKDTSDEDDEDDEVEIKKKPKSKKSKSKKIDLNKLTYDFYADVE
jgi:hypothetical protein